MVFIFLKPSPNDALSGQICHVMKPLNNPSKEDPSIYWKDTDTPIWKPDPLIEESVCLPIFSNWIKRLIVTLDALPIIPAIEGKIPVKVAYKNY